MGDLSLASVLSLKVETTPGVFAAPNNTTDLITCAELKGNIQGLTADIKEFIGTKHRPGPKVLGKTFEVSGRILLRGPGGASPPAADVLVIGRLLRAACFAESIVSVAIPAAPEAVGAGGTVSSVVLGATAAATADLYKGKMVQLSHLGAGKAGLSMVRTNDATKLAVLPETSGTPISDGNWQLIKQIAYMFSPGDGPSLSASVWLGSRRIDGVGLAISAFKINMPTSSKNSQDVPSIEFTLSGDVQGSFDDTAPTPPVGLAVPPFRDGKLWIANKQLGGSTVTIDFAAQVAAPPNPNRPTGSEASQTTETTRTVDMTLNQTTLANFDDVGMADGQGYYPLYAMWGLASGNCFGVLVTDMRFNYRSPDNSGDFVTNTGQAFIDGADRTINLVFGFPPTF